MDMKPVGATSHATRAGGKGYKMEFMYKQDKESDTYDV
jgi:hypothetical protein